MNGFRADQDAYLPALDGLRALSILLVVASHLGLGHIIPGGLGVTIFFFISGFIITRMLLSENARCGAISLTAFYVKRAFRLAPALLVYILLCLLSFAALGEPIPLLDITAAIFYAANYYNVFHGWGGGAESPLSILWSLAVEEHFYLAFPLLLLVMRRRLGKCLLVLCALSLAVLAWRLYLTTAIGLDQASRIYISTDTRIDSILFGCLVSLYSFWTASLPRLSKHHTVAAMLCSRPAVLAGVVIIIGTLLYRNAEFRQTWRYSLQGVAMAPLFLHLFIFRRLPYINTVVASRPMIFVGQISYSLYLYHWLALAFLAELTQSGLPGRTHLVELPLRTYLVALPLMLGLTLASYYGIETPIRRAGHRLAARLVSAPPPPVVAPSDGRTFST